MLNADDYFAKKRAELGLDRADQLTDIQALLDSWYPGQTRAKSLNNGILQIVTPSSVVAGELRMRQVELLALEPLHGIVAKLKLSVEAL